MRKTVLVPLADGTEEIEAVCIIDTLRRAQAEVTVASVGTLQVTASRGTHLVADALITDCTEQTFDMIALPGGMPGAANLAASEALIALLQTQQKKQRWIAAICAAPAVVLQPHGLLKGVRATCYPAMREQLERPSHDRVVIDQKVITSQGPGVALEFALTLADVLYGTEMRRKLAEAMLVDS